MFNENHLRESLKKRFDFIDFNEWKDKFINIEFDLSVFHNQQKFIKYLVEQKYNFKDKINNIEITDEMKSLAENMTKASGRSELKMYKNGFDLWLNSFQTSLVAVGGSAALGFLVGLIPGIGASLAGTLLAAILPVISGEYCPNGIFVSYRFNQYLRVRPQ